MILYPVTVAQCALNNSVLKMYSLSAGSLGLQSRDGILGSFWEL